MHRSVARVSLEGLLGGAVLGAYLARLEQSSTFHVYADVLSATARVLGPAVSEATRTRLDVAAVGFLIYVGVHALAGCAAGALLGASPLGEARSSGIRTLVFAGLFALADGVALGAVWQHRSLPVGVGWALVISGAVLAGLGAGVAGRLVALLPARPRAALATVLPSAGVVVGAVLVVAAAREPTRPPGALLESAVRVDGSSKVVLIALDGLDGRLVDEALAGGRLPNLRGLLERGVRGDLRSIRPPKSPVVWTSAVTGALPRVHGILDFVVRREGERVPVTSNLRRVPALWNLARPLGFTVAFVNWYVTWPAEPVAGAIVSDRADFDGLPDRVSPDRLTAAIDSARARLDAREERDITRFVAGDAGLPVWRTERWGQVRRSLGILDDVVRHDLFTLSSTEILLANGQPDLTAVYFRGTDNTQHLFWKHRLAKAGSRWAGWIYGDVDSTEVRILAPVIDRYYDFADELLGRTLALVDRDSAILVVSDHGFLTNNERGRWFGPNRLLAAAGLATLVPGTGGLADPARSVVLDPEPPSVDARRVLRPGSAAVASADALAQARGVLAALRTDRGEPVLRSTALGEDERGPYLAIVFDPAVRGRRVELDGSTVDAEEFLQPEGHSGDHRMDGFLLAAGPPFRTGRIRGARAIDLGPTILHLLGAPAARDQEGVVLVDLFEPSWLEAHPVRYVESYGVREEARPAVIASEADERIREELRALGYLK